MSSSKDAPAKFRPYLFHGVDLNYGDEQAQGDCPFCQKPGHFGIKASTGQFRCVRCEQRGNVYSFLKLLIEESLTRTSDEDYALLSKDRGISVDALKVFQFCKSMITGDWLVPGINENKVIGTIYRIVQEPIKAEDYPAKGSKLPANKKTHKWVCMATPECKQHPVGVQTLRASQDTVNVCEGIWDGPALYDCLSTVRLGTPNPKSPSGLVMTTDIEKSILPKEGVLGVPGAGVFIPEYMSHLNGKNVNLLYDNDHPRIDKNTGEPRLIKGKPIRPGWDGQQRAIGIIQESSKRPRSLKQFLWTQIDLKDTFASIVLGDNKIPLTGIVGYNPNIPDGFDIRDAKRALGPVRTLLLINSGLDTVRLATIKTSKDKLGGTILEPIPRNTFEDLCKDWSDSLHFTNQLKSTLAVSLAVVVSTELPTDALWFRIIGPPGSGKSTIAEAITAARPYVMAKSVLRGFHSGYTGGDTEKERAEDASLIPMMRGKTMIIKDGDTLINSPARDKILSELRDIYDGTSRSHYLNRKSQDYEDIRTTFILCGTDALRQLNRSSLGERFLDCEILGDEETSPYLDRAFGNTLSRLSSCLEPDPASLVPSNNHEAYNPEKELFLKRTTYGYIHYLKENFAKFPQPEFSTQAEVSIKAMGQLLSYMRARVTREGIEITHRPRVELATRIVAQLVKLAFCLSLVLGKRKVDDEVLAIVRKVVLDSAEGFQYEITSLLMTHYEIEHGISPSAQPSKHESQTGGAPGEVGNDSDSKSSNKNLAAKMKAQLASKAKARKMLGLPNSKNVRDSVIGLSARQIASKLNLAETNVRRILADLQEFNIVCRASIANNSGQRGRDIHIWQPTDIMINLWESAHTSVLNG